MCFHRPALSRRTVHDAASCLMNIGGAGRFNIVSRAAVGVVLIQLVVAVHASLWNSSSLLVELSVSTWFNMELIFKS